MGDEENRDENDSRSYNSNVDLSNAASNQIDDSGVFKDEGADDFLCFTDTMPIDDTFLFGDAFETQFVDLAGETQVMDFGGETQVMDYGGETQVMDYGGETQLVDDLDYMKNMNTELLNERSAEVVDVSDSEGTKETEVLCDTQEVSLDDYVEVDSGYSVGRKNEVDSYPHEKGDNASRAPSDIFGNEKHHSGPVCRGFTSIRTASIRASGLAARARGAKDNSCSISSDISSMDQQTFKQVGPFLVDQLKSGMKTNVERPRNEYNANKEEKRNTNTYKTGNTTMRKLVMEDEVGESEAEMNNADDKVGMSNLYVSGNCLAGLSYANSQEPGELSQANALEVVDKFLELNVMEYDRILESGTKIGEKSKVVVLAKGSRDLAKSSILKSSDRECGIYDWDNTREDEGGGEFFLKKKDHFFDKRGSKQSKSDYVDEKERILNKKKLGDSVRSGSGLMLHKLRAKGKSLFYGEEAFHENLSRDLDEQINVASGKKLLDNDTSKDIPDVDNIGPDTQIAAEAMETLCFEVNLADSNINFPSENAQNTTKTTRKRQYSKKMHCPTGVGVVTRQAKQMKRIIVGTANDSSPLPIKESKNARKRNHADECPRTPPPETNEQTESREGKRNGFNEIDPFHNMGSTVQGSEKKRRLHEQLGFSVPVAHRTRKCALNDSKVAANSVDARDDMNDLISDQVVRKRRTVRDKNAVMVTVEQLRKVRSIKCVGTSSASYIEKLGHLKKKGTRKEKLPLGQEAEGQSNVRLKRSKAVTERISSDPGRSDAKQSSNSNSAALSSLNRRPQKIILGQNVNNESVINFATERDSGHLNEKEIVDNAMEVSVSKQFDNKSEGPKANKLGASPKERFGTSLSDCTTPATCSTPVKNPSPICVGDEYQRQSCRKSLSRSSLMKEINNLRHSSPEPFGRTKEARKRRDITNIRVLFSQHLDVDVIKQQKKILVRLGAGVASSMLDATHFVADEFVRTRNMLEAIAFGKPVVTHLWLESCGQASCLIDEKNYILRDAKKEKEFGFCMPVSLSRACQHPLLQGQKVLITRNTKPGQDILANLVKAVHGLAVERLGRSVLKDEKFPDDLLILSCEEDYDVCVPFLEKGGSVYSSELLLNGIVIQKLEYERHHLFTGHVKRTRSTIWVNKKNRYLPVTKCK
ncbi:hypothetical protein BUALT_Bualt14G0080800 [Buddleja alternifolia]|uniref:BRCT domain-containing protein n=1 Tax=Buddleja alternifolia TaxID=168488 RepID=A0AAV6WQJ2_9LAMI|nr:hypothetical protein BUALT_Bualt14G0080800 [Buddleja alternifolia]